MIEQGLNYTYSTVKEMSVFFETTVENLEHKEDKKKSSAAAKKIKEKEIHQEMQTGRLQHQRCIAK